MAKETDPANRQLAKLSDYKKVFGTVQGKRVLWDLMKLHGMLQSSKPDNPNQMMFNEGGRNVIIGILQKVESDIPKLRELITKGDDYEY